MSEKDRRSGPGDPAAVLVGPAQAAARLCVSRQYVYTLINDGRLRSVKLGRRRLIPAVDLDRLAVELLAQADDRSSPLGRRGGVGA